MQRTWIGFALAASLLAVPCAALAGPSTYDLGVFLGQPDPFAAAFYGQQAASPVLIAPAAIPTLGPTVPAAVIAGAPPATVPVEVRLTPAAPPTRNFLGLALDRAYFSLSAGTVVANKTKNQGGGVNNTHDYDAGIGLTGAYGYRWREGVTTEVEIAWRRVPVGTITEASTGVAQTASGTISLWSILANATKEFDWDRPLTPYVLGGLGFAFYSANAVTAADSTIVSNGDWVIAYQLGGGFMTPLRGRWWLDASYRYFLTTQPELANADARIFKSDHDSHNLSLGLRYHL